MWLGCGYIVARVWLQCGEGVARVWLRCGYGEAMGWLEIMYLKWRLCELALKNVSPPLHAVLDDVRERLERADGDRVVGRVSRGAVGGGQVGKHHLCFEGEGS